jgi:hypothetical protein
MDGKSPIPSRSMCRSGAPPSFAVNLTGQFGSARGVWSLIALLLVFTAVSVRAEFSNDQKFQLTVNVSSLGFDSPSGGFYPVEVELENLGPGRVVEIRTESDGALTTQAIRLESLDRVKMLLLHPVVQFEGGSMLLGYNGFTVKVFVSGREVESVRKQIHFENISRVINIWWIGGLSGAALDTMAHAYGARWTHAARDSGYAYSGGSSSPKTGSYDIQQARDRFRSIRENEIPPRWQGLTTGDILICPWQVLSTLEAPRRTAILEWVQSGGILLTMNAPQAAEDADLLWRQWGGSPLRIRSHESSQLFCHWVGGDLQGEIHHLMPAVDPSGDPGEEARIALAVARWIQGVSVQKGTYLYGNAVESTLSLPRPGAPRAGWSAIEALQVPMILKRSPWAIICFVLIWVLVLFPMQYHWLRVKKRLGWLPALTCITSVVWMGTMTNYGVFTQGLGIRSIDRSWTMLDQRSHRAVITGYTSLVSGRSRSGVSLPENGWLLPSPTPNHEAWQTVQQESRFTYQRNSPEKLAGPWLAPRSLRSLELRQVKPIRERLALEVQADGSLKITNGLGAAVHELSIYDRDRSWGPVKNLAANESITVPSKKFDPQTMYVEKVESWFNLREIADNYKGARFYLARVQHPSWVHFGFDSKREEGTEHWIGGIW